jgi:hypothetical protein
MGWTTMSIQKKKPNFSFGRFIPRILTCSALRETSCFRHEEKNVAGCATCLFGNTLEQLLRNDIRRDKFGKSFLRNSTKNPLWPTAHTARLGVFGAAKYVNLFGQVAVEF